MAAIQMSFSGRGRPFFFARHIEIDKDDGPAGWESLYPGSALAASKNSTPRATVD
jgi:hypothetical protein